MTSSSTTYRRVSRVALFDGWGLIIFGAISLFFGIIDPNPTGIVLGMGLTTLGAIELQGRRFWMIGEPRAIIWLAGSQMGTLLLLVSYAARSYRHPPIWRISQLSQGSLELLAVLPNYDAALIDDLLPYILRITYLLLIVVVLTYQGGMAFYYLRAGRQLGERPPPLRGEGR